MLSATNGVITEDRFQKMTPLQWVFQFVVLKEAERKAGKDRNTLIELATQYGDLIVAASNPQMGKALKEAKDLAKYKDEIGAESAAEVMADIEENTPAELPMFELPDTKKSAVLLPTSDKRKISKPRFIVNKE